MKTLKDLGDLKGKRVLMRADFNVPLDGTTITDDGRIKAALPTITALREEGAKVILMAHLGRPKGKVVPELSLAPVAARLGELLGANVPLAKDTYGEDAQAKVAAMNDGDVVLLEAGDAVPADGRLLESASMKIEEAALTGESVPVTKAVGLLTGDNVPLGDRKNMCYMGSTVVYGRGKAVITATGMDTEMGKIAGVLAQTEQELH